MWLRALTDAMLFHPARGQSRTPRDLGLAYEEVALVAEDRVRTQAWWIPAEGARWVILFFHGNAGTMSDRLENARALRDLGAAVMLAEYRGYGDSEGTPSEEGLYADARAAVREARRRAGERRVVLFGRSLGGAVAIDAATREPIGGLVIESSFTNLPDMARAVMPLPGVSRLVSYRFDSLPKIRSIDRPVLVIHGDADRLVPFWMGRELAEAAPDAVLHRVAGGDHAGTWLAGGRAYWEAWRRFLARL